MADKRTTPETPEDAPQTATERPRRKKRAAPTIDLTATEVPPPQEAAPHADPPRQQPDPPPAAEASGPTDSAPAEPPPKRIGGAFVAAFAGGAGVAATLLILLGLYVAGLLPPRQATPTTATTQAADGKALEALTGRTGKIEQALGNIAPGDESVAARLAAVRSSISALSTDLVALYRHNDEISANAKTAGTRAEAVQKALTELSARLQELSKTAMAGISAAELDALQKRIAALEQSAKLARDDIAKASSADIAARLALSAAILRDAVTSGAPFSAELAQAKALGANDKILMPLTPFAAAGIPNAPALARELNALLPAMIKIANASAPQGGFLERLEANAGKLVRIRPVAAPPGDEPSAVLARLEIDTAKANIAGALGDLGKLDEATRAPAQGWMQKAQARQAALAAASQFAADTAHALAPKAAGQ